MQRKIVVQLCGMTRPAQGVEDIAAGKVASAALKQVVSHEGIIVDAKQAAINERRARESKRQKQIGEQQQEIQRLHSRFATLSAQQPRTIAERQTRGYELESLLAALLRANDLDYTGSTRQPHEQVDGILPFPRIHLPRRSTLARPTTHNRRSRRLQGLSGWKTGKHPRTVYLHNRIQRRNPGALRKRQRQTQRRVDDRPGPRPHLRRTH